MAVLRDLECRRGHRRELRVDIGVPVACCACLRLMRPIISLGTVQCPTDRLFPFVHPHLSHKPVEVRSWKHYKQLLRERGASNELAS